MTDEATPTSGAAEVRAFLDQILRWTRTVLQVIAELVIVVGPLSYLLSLWLLGRYYGQVGLSPQDVGLGPLDIAIASTPLIFITLAVAGFVSVMARRRDSPDISRLPRAVLAVVAAGMLVLLWVVVVFLSGRLLADGDPGTSMFMVAEPRLAQIVPDGECMVLVGTNEDVWLLWSPDEDVLYRRGVGSVVLRSCERPDEDG